jgi:CheY-like chemotaxis protein/anti-sigma regulatory factor (Ser/Thr protein kinase)
MIDFEFATVTRGAAAALSAIAAEKSLRLDIEFGDRAPTWVRGDPTRVRQVVQNLVGNALKFTMSGGVTVRTTGTADGHVQVEVRDTGIGIAPEALSRLFGKFEQADQSTTRRFGGTGLGLSIVKQLVDAMGGTVTVASTLGVGTTFTVTLPLDPGMPTTETALPPLARHSRRLRILCAEDYPTNQVIIRAILADLGHDAVVVDTGRAALVALAREPFDLVLMDGRMPEMDGETAVRHLRTGRWEDRTFLDPKVRVVALTANASPEDRARFLASGMDAFLTKPVAERALHAELETAIRYQLERGITLPPLGVVGAAALDALFGITDDDDSSPSAPTPFRATVAIAAVAPLEERLRAAFVATVSDRFADLVRAVERADGEAILLLSHGLKGSAGYADAPDVVSAAGAIEAAARDGDLSHVDELLPTLRDALAPFLLLGAA